MVLDVAPEILKRSGYRKYTRAVDIWSLGVVLYICLCGFPPFSDELMNEEFPYSLMDQIQMGIFDFPSPYWDSVGDPALDLIDKMLNINMDERLTIEKCLQHPWVTQNYDSSSRVPNVNPNDSIDGLTPAMNNLDFSKRKVVRTRTLIRDFNKVTVSKEIDGTSDKPAVKIFQKNTENKLNKSPAKTELARKVVKEHTPAALRAPEEFIRMGGKGDEVLFDEDSKYESSEMVGLMVGDVN
jgi:serine/threonine-protein kinase CHEK2